MKIFKSAVSILILLSLSLVPAAAKELKVGEKAPGWSFNDADGKAFTPAFWKDKVIVINYVDPDEADLNLTFTDALKKARKNDLLKDETYKAFGIVDCASTWKPDFLIRVIAGKKAKKYNTTILFDYDATLRNLWGLKPDTHNVIVLDKNRVCRAIIRGKVADDQLAGLLKLVMDLQSE